MSKRLKTRGPATAQAIADRIPFRTHGALYAVAGTHDGSGRLNSDEARRFFGEVRDCDQTCYVVYSYDTPIAWWTPEHGWHIVEQRFSVTTTRHQSRLPLIRESAA